MTEALSPQQWLESRVRDSARATAKRIRRIAEDIEAAADREKLENLPTVVMNLVVWGMANASPEDPARQLAEYNKAERAGHFKTENTDTQEKT